MLVLTRREGEEIVIGEAQWHTPRVYITVDRVLDANRALVRVVLVGQEFEVHDWTLGREPTAFTLEGRTVELSLTKAKGRQAIIGVTAPRSLAVHRRHIWDQIAAERRDAGGGPIRVAPAA